MAAELRDKHHSPGSHRNRLPARGVFPSHTTEITAMFYLALFIAACIFGWTVKRPT